MRTNLDNMGKMDCLIMLQVDDSLGIGTKTILERGRGIAPNHFDEIQGRRSPRKPLPSLVL